MSNFVELNNVHFAHGERSIYEGLSLTVPKGKTVAVMGPSGIGKTTLLRLIGGQLKPTSGSIKVAGEEVPALSRKPLYELRKRMSMLFQSGALFTDMSVFDNVAFPLREHTDLPETLIRSIVIMKLEAVGLRGARHLMPAELSGGMARRAALDPISMGVIVKLIKSLNDSLGLTSIVVTHDVDEVLSIADYAYIIADKRVVAEGEPKALLSDETAIVKQFLHGEADGPVAFHYSDDDFATDLLKGAQ